MLNVTSSPASESLTCLVWDDSLLMVRSCGQGTAYGYVARNAIWNGAEVYRWCQANQIIFELNECVNVADNGGGGDIDNCERPASLLPCSCDG